MIMKYPDKEFFFCRVTKVIWVLKHFANQASSYLIPTFTGDESPASRHDFFQKLAYRLCMSGVIFSRMVLQRKKYFQWSTSRWVGNVNSLENAIKGRLLLEKLHILCGTHHLGKRDKTACGEWLFYHHRVWTKHLT